MIGAFTDHLWQSTIFVLAAALVAAALRQNGAHVRHRIWLIASLKFLLPLSVLMSLGSALAGAISAELVSPTPLFGGGGPDLSMAVEQITQPFTSGAFAPTGPAPQAGTNWMPWLFAGIWAGGFVAVVGMRARGWQRVRAALRASVSVPVTAPVPVRSSPGLLEPGVVGLWRPVLLVPAGIERQLTPRQFEAVLLHELCHVQRRDNLTSAIHMVVEAVFWFHPLVWFVGARLVDERERACDEYVLRECGDSALYAESILSVCKLYVESPIACVSGVTGSDLRKRIAAILLNRVGRQLNLARKAALVLVAALAVTLPVLAGMLTASTSAAAQTAAATVDKSRFDVVSIKPCPKDPPPPAAAPAGLRRGGAPWHATVSQGYAFWSCATLAQLIDQAYADQDHPLLNIIANPRQDLLNQPKRVRGGPSWVETEKFTLEARAPVEVTSPGLAGSTGRILPTLPATMAQALRVVLEDRFKVQVHRATEQQSMFALAIAKGGLNKQQIVAPVPGDCLTPAEYATAAAAGEVSRTNERMICGRYHVSIENGMRFSSFTLQQLARELSTMMDHFVLDRTGVESMFNFTIKTESADGPRGDSLRFSRALEGLGLNLEPTKGPAEYLVIDRVEKLRPDLAASAFAPAQDAGAMARQAASKFDVASIKPCEGGAPEAGRAGGAGRQASPGYLHFSCMTLRQLVLQAYAGPDNRLLNRKWEEQFVEGFPAFVKGGPSWAYSERFTIEAKAEGVTDRNVLTGPMLRALLEDRFQLKHHREAEDRSMLALTVGKAGLKIQTTAPGSCLDLDPEKLPAPGPTGRMNGTPCGVATGDGWGSAEYIGVTLGGSGRDGERLTDYLWRALRQPVIDRTGLAGRYTFKLEFTPDDTTPGVSGRCGGNADCMASLARSGISDTRPAAFSNSANIFKALEGLGLKLEQVRAPAEHIVIDHAERPRPNPPSPNAPYGRGFGEASPPATASARR